MSADRAGGPGRWRLAAPAGVAVLVAGVSLAGAGSAVAAPHAGPAVAAGVISTVAGGVGGPAKATTVSLSSPGGQLCGVSFGGGELYAGTGYAVREVNPQTDGLTTPTGTGVKGPLGLGKLAAKASLGSVCQTAVDGAGNLVITDQVHDRVLVVAHETGTFYGQQMTARHIYSVAGVGRQGFTGDGGPAASAKLYGPEGVAVDGAGNLVIADSGNNRVRVVAASSGTFYGQAMTAGDIYSVAGDGHKGFSGDGGPATSAKLSPLAVAVDGAGNLVIADTYDYRIRVVAESSGTFYGQAMTAGDIYTVAGDGANGTTGDGGPATSAELATPRSVAVDGAGNLVIADAGDSRVRLVAASSGTYYGQAMAAGDIYTVAGNANYLLSGNYGPATRAQLYMPTGMAVDGAGNLVIADTYNNLIRVAAATSGDFYGQAMTAGHIYKVAGGGLDTEGNGVLATSAGLDSPLGVAVDGAGNLVIADSYFNRVRVVAGSSGTFYGQAMIAGDIYTVAGSPYGSYGFSGDGGPATSAEMDDPTAVTLDGAGNLLIADTGNNRVRVVAESSGTFYGQAMTAGDIYTIAGDAAGGFTGDGGPATSAGLALPDGVAMDGAGNLVIADEGHGRIRVVAESSGTFYGQAMTAGDIYTVAGDGQYGFSGDGGPATSAGIAAPTAVAVDGAGNLVIADEPDGRIRVVAESSGTFYGQAMTAGDIYTVAGDGQAGFSGDGGQGTKAELANPTGVAVDGGNLVISDSDNNRIRMIEG